MTLEKYTKQFEVHYYEINRHQEATPLSVVNYLEETAISHSESVGLGVDKLKSDGIGWVLNRWLIHVEKYPMYGEKIFIKTWPSGFERFYATREFIIENSNGQVLGRASSLWLFLNIEKRRPVRIPQKVGEAYGIDPRKVLQQPFSEFSASDRHEPGKDFSVRRSDIDTNEHVNNAKYIEWFLESVPQNTYDDCILSSIEVEYKKESGYGSTITSSSKTIREGADDSEYFHRILDKDNQVELALAKTTWRNRQPMD